jgi:hypothetical protein
LSKLYHRICYALKEIINLKLQKQYTNIKERQN